MKFGSLFSGIGGLDLGLERAGMECVWQSEIDPYACKVLAKHWPDVPNLGDITQIDWSQVEPVDLICGGFPCQDVSVAGKQAGINQDTRSGLFHEFIKAIRILRPRYALFENVAGLLISNGGSDFGTVLAGIHESGYDAEWGSIRADWFGAPHRRERIFVVAYNRFNGMEVCFKRQIPGECRLQGFENVRRVEDVRSRPALCPSLLRRGSDGVPAWVDRLRGLGNAVVPQVAEYVGRCIMNHTTDTQP